MSSLKEICTAPQNAPQPRYDPQFDPERMIPNLR